MASNINHPDPKINSQIQVVQGVALRRVRYNGTFGSKYVRIIGFWCHHTQSSFSVCFESTGSPHKSTHQHYSGGEYTWFDPHNTYYFFTTDFSKFDFSDIEGGAEIEDIPELRFDLYDDEKTPTMGTPVIQPVTFVALEGAESPGPCYSCGRTCHTLSPYKIRTCHNCWSTT